MKKFLIAFAGVAAFATSSHATVTTFSDFASFQAALGAAPLITETFDGPASDFGKDSVGNPIGSGMTLDLIGPAGTSTDTGPTGLTGDGRLRSEVDSSEDVLSSRINFAEALFGFGFIIQDSGPLSSPAFDTEEVGIEIAGSSFLISDVTGDSDSSNGDPVPRFSLGPVFVGFISDTAFSSINLVHGDFIAAGGVNGFSEAFSIDTAYLSPAVAVVPLPAGLPLLLAGLGGLALLRRKRG